MGWLEWKTQVSRGSKEEVGEGIWSETVKIKEAFER